MKKVALCFWGVVRNFHLTHESIKQNIYNVLSNNGYDFDVYMHLNKIDQIQGYRASGENNIPVDFSQYKLLAPDYFSFDDQNLLCEQIDMTKYKIKRDPWRNQYKSVELFVLSMYSKHKVTQMLQKTSIVYDYVIFLRPDVLYVDPLPVQVFDTVNDSNCCLPSFGTWTKHKHMCKVNDRFSISVMKIAELIGSSYTTLHEYCENYECHSESFLSYNLHNNNVSVLPIPNFKFIRVRADGKIPIHDLKQLRSEKLMALGFRIHKYIEGDGKLINIHDVF